MDISTMATMQFDVTQDFPAGLEQLWSALGCTDYVEEKYRWLGSTSLRIQKFTFDVVSIEVELDRQAPVAREKLPVWARVFSGEKQAMHHHTRWRWVDRDRVDVDLEIRALGLPVRAHGTGSIIERVPGESRMTLHFDVSSGFGAMSAGVARVFAQQVKHALQEDHAFTLGYLQARPHRQ
jgi:hypothetical protein